MLNTKIDRRIRSDTPALGEPFDVAKMLETEIAETVRDPLLQTRQQTHGDFALNAAISQRLKAFFREADGWRKLSEIEREALDMIALKFSRILSGRSMEHQHWSDVAGYAKLVEEKCA